MCERTRPSTKQNDTSAALFVGISCAWRKLLFLDLKSNKNVEWHRVQPSAGSPLDSAKHLKYHLHLNEAATIRFQRSKINI